MRWILRLLALVVVLAVGAVAAFFLVPADRIAGLVEDRFEAATGRALTVAGDVRPRLLPELGVATGAVSIANAPWSDSGPMVAADGLSVSVDWGALFGGEVRITGVTLDRPRIVLEASAEGANWELGAPGGGTAAPAGSPAAGGAAPAIGIDRATLNEGTLIYRDAAGQEIVVEAGNATLTLPDASGPLALSGTARINGAETALDLEIPAFASFLGAGTEGVALSLDLGDASLRYAGRVGLDPLAVAGALNGTLGRLEGLSTALGIDRPDLPRGLGRDGISLDGRLAYSDDALTVTAAEVGLDQNLITGDLAVALDGVRPRITGALDLGAFDLASGAEPAEEAPETDSSGWSTEPIDVSGLGVVDLGLEVSADSITTPESRIGPTRLALALDDRRLVTTIRNLSAYDGTVAGQIVVNGRGGMSASADLAGSALAISRLSSELLDFDRLVALGDMEISVLGSGNSMNALMTSLNGDGAIRFGAGELLGLDLVGMLRNLDLDFGGATARTIFNSITATFRIVDGVVINDNLLFDAPLLTATGAGRINLGGQSLDYRIVPKLIGGEGEGLSVPIIVSGSWDAPRFRLDLENLVSDRLEEEAEKVLDDARNQLRDNIGRELGAGEGESAEDALRRSLQDSARDGLRNLLGR